MVAWEARDQYSYDYDIMGRSVYRLFADGFEDGTGVWSVVSP